MQVGFEGLFMACEEQLMFLVAEILVKVTLKLVSSHYLKNTLDLKTLVWIEVSKIHCIQL